MEDSAEPWGTGTLTPQVRAAIADEVSRQIGRMTRDPVVLCQLLLSALTEQERERLVGD
jgi:hypothetical protein